nr:uncharacterized protein LOC109750925 [Aegilops tauschii subsp. strangulata]XP_045089253.1 uncharacterized protein LOC109750925 [Aegilops tauschii subsp. strangulata]
MPAGDAALVLVKVVLPPVPVPGQAEAAAASSRRTRRRRMRRRTWTLDGRPPRPLFFIDAKDDPASHQASKTKCTMLQIEHAIGWIHQGLLGIEGAGRGRLPACPTTRFHSTDWFVVGHDGGGERFSRWPADGFVRARPLLFINTKSDHNQHSSTGTLLIPTKSVVLLTWECVVRTSRLKLGCTTSFQNLE